MVEEGLVFKSWESEEKQQKENEKYKIELNEKSEETLGSKG